MNHLLAAEPDEHELWKVLKNRKCGSAPGGDGNLKFVDFYKSGSVCSAGGWFRSRLDAAAGSRSVYLED